MAGLGARDSLRLEAGLCLYGSDIDSGTTPGEAGLIWTIGKRRRKEADFPGAQKILKQIGDKSYTRKRVGLVSHAGPPARHGMAIIDPKSGNKVGQVTSGCPAPSMEPPANICMAYVEPQYAKIGTDLLLEVRKRNFEAKVTKMPFVPNRYYVK